MGEQGGHPDIRDIRQAMSQQGVAMLACGTVGRDRTWASTGSQRGMLIWHHHDHFTHPPRPCSARSTSPGSAAANEQHDMTGFSGTVPDHAVNQAPAWRRRGAGGRRLRRMPPHRYLQRVPCCEREEEGHAEPHAYPDVSPRHARASVQCWGILFPQQGVALHVFYHNRKKKGERK